MERVGSMAFIVKRKGRKGIYALYHDRSSGKQVQIPRKLTSHLDNLPIEEAQAWVDKWEANHGMVVQRSQRINLAEDDRLNKLWERYQLHMTNTRKRRVGTTMHESALFFNHITHFFVAKHQRKKPETWHDLIPEFHVYLFEKKLQDSTIRGILWALERFGEYLVWSRLMPFKYTIHTPSRQNIKVTPLKVRLSPEQVLQFVNETLKDGTLKKITGGRRHIVTEKEIRLSILLGYFAGLRPSEQWALNKSDFLTGADAEENTNTLDGFRKYNLGSKLSLSITKTWQIKGGPAKIEELTKSHYSRSVVNVWHVQAANLIGSILKGLKDGPIFSIGYHGMGQLWRREVLPRLNVTAHDLRRASGFYLGRVKRVDITLLQDHLRHAEIETTMLYTRDPFVPELKQKKRTQNFDDLAF